MFRKFVQMIEKEDTTFFTSTRQQRELFSEDFKLNLSDFKAPVWVDPEEKIKRGIRKKFLEPKNNDEDTDSPYPYIFKPPHPPEDIAPAGQAQIMQAVSKEESEFEP